METTGIRDLRDHLSEHLSRVRRGEVLTVTDRGTAIAQIVPIGERPYDRLVKEGKIIPPSRPRSLPKKLIKPTGSVSALVAEQRR
jgi:prevent-host-death family protein